MSKLRNIIREEIFDFEKFIKDVPFKLERPWILYYNKEKIGGYRKYLNAQKLMFKLGYRWFDGDEILDEDPDNTKDVIGLMQPNIFSSYSHLNHDGDWFIVSLKGERFDYFIPNSKDDYNIYYLEDIEKMLLKESDDFQWIRDVSPRNPFHFDGKNEIWINLWDFNPTEKEELYNYLIGNKLIDFHIKYDNHKWLVLHCLMEDGGYEHSENRTCLFKETEENDIVVGRYIKLDSNDVKAYIKSIRG